MILSADEQIFLLAPDIEPVIIFLEDALKKKEQWNSHNYDQIVAQLKSKDDPEMLWRVYIGLSSFALRFTKRADIFHELITAIYSYNWSLHRKVSVAFASLLWNMISANLTYLQPIYNLLVKSFVPSADLFKFQKDASADCQEIQVEVEYRLGLIHRVIMGIVSIAPTAESELFPILSAYFPHKRFDVIVQRQYTQQILRVCEYIPTLRSETLDLILSRCLEIDVEIVIEDSGDVKIQPEYDHDGDELFQLDEDDSKLQGRLASRQSSGGHRIPAEVVEMADKLDAMLVLVIAHLDKIMNTGDAVAIQKLFLELLSVFEKRILTTHRSKFVQFIVFYVASKDARFGGAFADRLLRLFVDETEPLILRQSAVMYLASYISRAIFLPVLHTSSIVASLLGWADAYATSNERSPTPRSTSTGSGKGISAPSSSCAPADGLNGAWAGPGVTWTPDIDEFGRRVSGPDALEKHETFFYCVQAVCYILCFHGTELASQHRMDGALRQQWGHVLGSPLQPLRYCLSSVRYEFLRLAEHVGLLDDSFWSAFPMDLREPAGGDALPAGRSFGSPRESLNQGLSPLDSFFPFDPCLLSSLYQWVEASYRGWDGIPGLSDEDDAALDEEQEEEDDDQQSNSLSYSSSSMRTGDMACSVSSAVSSFGASRSLLEMGSAGSYSGEAMSVPKKTLMKMAGGRSSMPRYRSNSIGSNAGEGGSGGSVFNAYQGEGAAPMIRGVIEQGAGAVVDRYQLDPDRQQATEANVMSLADWPMPVRRPRQYSISSTGSW